MVEFDGSINVKISMGDIRGINSEFDVMFWQ